MMSLKDRVPKAMKQKMTFERSEEYTFCRDLKALWGHLDLTWQVQGFQNKVESFSQAKAFV